MADILKECLECKSLVGRRVQPHSFLKLTDSRRVSSAMGPADEAYYKCSQCGRQWLHETGSCGFGWIEMTD